MADIRLAEVASRVSSSEFLSVVSADIRAGWRLRRVTGDEIVGAIQGCRRNKILHWTGVSGINIWHGSRFNGLPLQGCQAPPKRFAQASRILGGNSTVNLSTVNR